MSAAVAVTLSHADSMGDVADLRDWLSREAVVRSARLDTTDTDPEAQGGVVDTVNLILADGAALVAIVETVRNWLSMRRKPSLIITIESGDSTTTVTLGDGP